jgi:hypothetical protein
MNKSNFNLLITNLTGLGLLILVPNALAIQAIVTNEDGRSFEGEIKLLPDNRLSLDVEAGEGSASYVFSKESLARIEYLDGESVEDGLDASEQNQSAVAISYLEDVHRGRTPFYKLVPDPQAAEPSLVLGTAYLEVGRYADATGVAGVLLGNDFPDPVIHAKANEILLMAFFGLKRWDETEILSKRWCENHEPFDESALGWWILSEVHLAREETEKARWISLQPITFSSQFPKAYLQDCFHVAIESWIEESPEQALRLYKQYQDRGFKWPIDKHPQTRQAITNLTLSVEAPDQEEESLDPLSIEEGEPKKDLNLPLETVRKLTTQNEPSQTP